LLTAGSVSRYYKQRYRPTESRSAVVAVKEETLSRALARAGVDSERALVGQVVRMDPKTYRMNLRAVKSARRHAERVKLRTETNANKFHKRPDIGV
jgi:hypothetical protein